MAAVKTELTQLGKKARTAATPQKAVLETIANANPGTDYVIRLSAPEFTTVCPITGQPDFAVIVIDYAPWERLVESKSLKLFLGASAITGPSTRIARSISRTA